MLALWTRNCWVVPSCPNESAAYNLAAAALADIGVNARVRTSVIASDAEARTRGFTGSPTFLINGHRRRHVTRAACPWAP